MIGLPTDGFACWIDHSGINILLMLLSDIGNASQAVGMQTGYREINQSMADNGLRMCTYT